MEVLTPNIIRARQMAAYLKNGQPVGLLVPPDQDVDHRAYIKKQYDSGEPVQAYRFRTETVALQFAQNFLLSAEKRLNWLLISGYELFQSNIDNRVILIDYIPYDLLFITYKRGEISNQFLIQSLNQVAILRTPPKKTVFLFTDVELPLSVRIEPFPLMSPEATAKFEQLRSLY